MVYRNCHIRHDCVPIFLCPKYVRRTPTTPGGCRGTTDIFNLFNRPTHSRAGVGISLLPHQARLVSIFLCPKSVRRAPTTPGECRGTTGIFQFIQIINAQSCQSWNIVTATSGTTVYQYSYALKVSVVPLRHLACRGTTDIFNLFKRPTQSCRSWNIITATSGTTVYQYSYALKYPSCPFDTRLVAT